MTIPVYKVETYTGATLDHTFTDQVLFSYKNVITDGVGTFTFTLPIGTGTVADYPYNDIALWDKVKIYVGYDSVPANPNFVGRITTIRGPLKLPDGYLRTYSGLDLGEVLMRRQKTNKMFNNVDADVVIDEIVNDLSSGTETLAHDHTKCDNKDSHETIEIPCKTYFDLLQQASDYYIDGTANDVKEDFFVDVDSILNWKSRPLRSGANVETLTVGENIISYEVTKDLNAVRNNITVYGFAEKPYPADKDEWTEDDADPPENWTANPGTVTSETPAQKGTYYVHGTVDAGTKIAYFYRTIPRVTVRWINQIRFWQRILDPLHCTTLELRLLCPDTSNWVSTPLTKGIMATYRWEQISIGPSYVYDAIDNPNGIWTVRAGAPNWWDIQGVGIYVLSDAVGFWADIDGLYFYPDRWSASATNAGSKTNYGQRDLEVTDDSLHSDAACTAKAETLLYQKKDPLTQIDIWVNGNTNILIGDRLSMTIPAEGITPSNYDVLSVEQVFDMGGFRTHAIMVNSSNSREQIESSITRMISNQRRHLRKANMNEQIL